MPYQTEVKQIQELGDTKTKKLVSQQIKLEQEQSALNLRKFAIVEQIKQLEQRKLNLAAQLLEVSGADKIQKLKDKLIEQTSATKKGLIAKKGELKKVLSQNGYLVFLPNFSIQFLNLLEQLRSDYINLNQQDYPLVQASPNSFEYTQITSVSSTEIDTISDN